MSTAANDITASGTWTRMLSARLVHNSAARVEQVSDDRVKVYVKTVRPRFLVPPLSWILPVRRERGAELDRLGTEVWNLCDGSRTVEEVIDEFAAAHGLTFHESRAAITAYAKMLVARGALAIVIQREEDNPNEAD